MDQSKIINLNVYYDGNDMYIEKSMLRFFGRVPDVNDDSKYIKITTYELDEICNSTKGSLIVVPKFYKLPKDNVDVNADSDTEYLKEIIKMQDRITDYLAYTFYDFLNSHLNYDPKRLSRILSDTCTNFFENEVKSISFNDDNVYEIDDDLEEDE